MKKPSKNKTTKRKISKRAVVVALILVAVMIPVVFSIVKQVNQQRQVDRLEIVTQDLKQVYDSLLKSLPNVKENSFEQSCGQSNIKYGGGTITCGPWARVIQGGIDSAQPNKEELVQMLKQNDNFKNLVVGDIHDAIGYSGEEYSIDFVHSITNTGCYFAVGMNNDKNSTGYSLRCSDVAPDFLPGYTRR